MVNICIVMTLLEQLIGNTNVLQKNCATPRTPEQIVHKLKSEVENYSSAIFDLLI